MKVSKQFSIVLAASVLAFGVATLAPQQVDASYGYKYTDSQRHQYPLQQVMLIQLWALL